jgi:hypothetical protein
MRGGGRRTTRLDSTRSQFVCLFRPTSEKHAWDRRGIWVPQGRAVDDGRRRGRGQLDDDSDVSLRCRLTTAKRSSMNCTRAVYDVRRLTNETNLVTRCTRVKSWQRTEVRQGVITIAQKEHVSYSTSALDQQTPVPHTRCSSRCAFYCDACSSRKTVIGVRAACAIFPTSLSRSQSSHVRVTFRFRPLARYALRTAASAAIFCSN